MVVQERYNPRPMAANTSVVINGRQLAGFIAVTSGTLTLTDGTGTVILNGFPVTAGVYHPLPLYLSGINGTVALAGGASGALLV